MVEQIAGNPDDWGFRTFAVGSEDARWRDVPVLQFKRQGRGPWAETGRINWTDETWFESGLAMLAVTLAMLERELPPETMPVAHDVRASHESGAHFVVTKDAAMLSARDLPGLREVNVVTPIEAGVLMGAWSRATGRNGLFSHWVAGDSMSYWALTRGITPGGWSAFGAFVRGSRVFERGDRIQSLAQSMFTRLDYMVEALDDLFVLWQRDVTNPVIDDISNLLDGALLRGWAVQDNVALLVSNWFGVGLQQPERISLHERLWRKAIRAHSTEGGRIIHALEPWRQVLRATESLRHHAVHRESFGSIRVQTADGQEHSRIFLPARVSADLRQDLRSAGLQPIHWGLEDQVEAHDVHHTVDHGGGFFEEFDEMDGGGAFLDPVPFTAQFVASVAGLANALFLSLHPETDPRLPVRLRTLAATPSNEKWASPEMAWRLILTSPLSGLILGRSSGATPVTSLTRSQLPSPEAASSP